MSDLATAFGGRKARAGWCGSAADILVAPDGMNSATPILDMAHDIAVAPYALICRRDEGNIPVVARVLRMFDHRINAMQGAALSR